MMIDEPTIIAAAAAAPLAAADPARCLEGMTIGVDGRPFTGPHTGFAMFLRSFLPPLLEAGAKVTLVSNGPLVTAPAFCARCGTVSLGENVGPVRWEQVSLRRHLESAKYDFYLASRNYGLPLLYRGPTTLLLAVLDLIPWRFPRVYFLKKPRFTAVYLASLFVALRKAKAIFTISEASKRDIARLAPGKPIHVNWIRLPEGSLPSNRSKPAADRPYFVYVGGMDPRKNNRLLLVAFARVRAEGGQEDLVLVGRGYEPLAPLIETLGLKESVRITGYVDDDTRTVLLAGALALVYPSIYEGFGLPVAEALQAGVRVITGTGGSLPEIGGSAAEYVDPITVETLAAAMRRVADTVPDEVFYEAARAQVARLTSAEIDRGIVATFVELNNARVAKGV